MKIARGCLPVSCTHDASRSPSLVVSSASTRTASRSPEMSVEVLAGQVAGVLSSHPGPPGIVLYPLLNTSTDNELVTLTPSLDEVIRPDGAQELHSVIAHLRRASGGFPDQGESRSSPIDGFPRQCRFCS